MKRLLKAVLTVVIVLLLSGMQAGYTAAEPWGGQFTLDYFSLSPDDTYRARLYLTGDLSPEWRFKTYFATVGDLEPEDSFLFSFAAINQETNHSYRYIYNRILEVNPENYYETWEHYQHVFLYGWGGQIGTKRWWTANYIALGIMEGDGPVGGFDFLAYNEENNHELTLEIKYDDFLYDYYRNLALKANWSKSIQPFSYGSDISVNLRQLPGDSELSYRYYEYNVFIQDYFLKKRLLVKLDRGGTENWEYPEWSYQYNQLELRYRFSSAFYYEALYRSYTYDLYAYKYTHKLVYELNSKNRLELSATNLAVSDYNLYNAIYDDQADTVRFSWVLSF